MRNCLVLLSMLLISGCATETYMHGYTFEQSDLDVIAVNKSKEMDVIAELGSPTSKSDFGPKTYYYISFKNEKIAFLEPKIIEQKVLAIEFGKNDVVRKITQYTLDDYNQIAFSQDSTEMHGNKITPMEQILSNVGKFNKKKR